MFSLFSSSSSSSSSSSVTPSSRLVSEQKRVTFDRDPDSLLTKLIRNSQLSEQDQDSILKQLKGDEPKKSSFSYTLFRGLVSSSSSETKAEAKMVEEFNPDKLVQDFCTPAKAITKLLTLLNTESYIQQREDFIPVLVQYFSCYPEHWERLTKAGIKCFVQYNQLQFIQLREMFVLPEKLEEPKKENKNEDATNLLANLDAFLKSIQASQSLSIYDRARVSDKLEKQCATLFKCFGNLSNEQKKDVLVNIANSWTNLSFKYLSIKDIKGSHEIIKDNIGTIVKGFNSILSRGICNPHGALVFIKKMFLAFSFKTLSEIDRKDILLYLAKATQYCFNSSANYKKGEHNVEIASDLVTSLKTQSMAWENFFRLVPEKFSIIQGFAVAREMESKLESAKELVADNPYFGEKGMGRIHISALYVFQCSLDGFLFEEIYKAMQKQVSGEVAKDAVDIVVNYLRPG